MSIYKAPDVADQPAVSLSRWQIFRVPDGDFHLCGTIPMDGHDGRVSSRLVRFDPKSRIGRTQSGRIYQLIGDPSHDGNAEYVRNIWLAYNGIDPKEVTFVTPEDVVLGDDNG